VEPSHEHVNRRKARHPAMQSATGLTILGRKCLTTRPLTVLLPTVVGSVFEVREAAKWNSCTRTREHANTRTRDNRLPSPTAWRFRHTVEFGSTRLRLGNLPWITDAAHFSPAYGTPSLPALRAKYLRAKRPCRASSIRSPFRRQHVTSIYLSSQEPSR
jgi:hypothetical protein